MATAQEWVLVCEELRASPDWNRSSAMKRLYQMAMEDGARALAAFPAADGHEDVVHDLLAVKLEKILEAESPRAYFLTAVRNAGCSRYRATKGRREPLEVLDERLPRFDADPLQRLDDLQRLERLPERERHILTLVAAGWARDEIAREYATSRENIDQIVSRARRRGSEER